MEKKDRMPGLEALRGISAIFIVLCHFEMIPFGQFGVYIFMCLSGFVSMLSTEKNKPGPFHFLIRQLIKITPLYWGVLMISFLAGNIVPSLFHTAVLSFRNLFLSMLYIPYSGSNGFYPVLPIGWFLNTVVAMYVLFAAAMKLSYKWRLEIMTGLVILVTFLSRIPEITQMVPGLIFWGNGMGFVFLAGGWLWKLYHTEVFIRGRANGVVSTNIGCGIAGVTLTGSLVGMIIMDIQAENRLPEFLKWGGYILCALLCIAASLRLNSIISQRKFWFLILAGRISMPLYLTHYFIVKFSERVLGIRGWSVIHIIVSFGVVGICLVAAWLIQKYLAEPITAVLLKQIKG